MTCVKFMNKVNFMHIMVSNYTTKVDRQNKLLKVAYRNPDISFDLGIRIEVYVLDTVYIGLWSQFSEIGHCDVVCVQLNLSVACK